MVTNPISLTENRFGFRAIANAVAGTLVRVARKVGFALQVRRERRALAALEPRLVKDIGLSTSTAYREANRGILDLPHQNRAGIERVRRFRTRN